MWSSLCLFVTHTSAHSLPPPPVTPQNAYDSHIFQLTLPLPIPSLLFLYSRVINSSSFLLLFLSFFFQVCPDKEALFTPLSAGRQAFNPHYTQLW